MRGLRLVGIALATLRTTETVKELLPTVPPPIYKSLFSVAVAAGMSIALGERNATKVVIEATAAAGAASLLHDAQDALKRFTDSQITNVMQHLPRRAGPASGGVPGRPAQAGPLGA